MKRNQIGLFSIVLFPILLMEGCPGCEDYQKFTITEHKTVPISYNIDKTGTFDVTAFVYEQDIKNTLNLPVDARDIKIEVENLKMLAITKEGTVPGNFSGGVWLERDFSIGQTRFITNYNQRFDTPVFSGLAVDANELLDAKGVDSLKNVLNTYANGTVTGKERIIFILKARHAGFLGGDARIVGTITGYVRVAVTYTACKKDLILLGDGKCE